MTASSGDTHSAARSDRRQSAREKSRHYMIAPAAPGMTRQALVDQLNRLGNVEILQTYPELDAISPPIAAARVSDENAAALRRSTAGAFIIEPDRFLRAASFAGTSPSFHAMAAIAPLGPDFTVTIQVLSESGAPVPQAEVRLLGEQAAAQGLTGNDGKVDLSLHAELPETVAGLFINARSGHWGLWRHRPDLQAGTVNSFTLEPLPLPDALDWGGAAIRFDQLPTECRGAGVKVALIDSGVAISHKQLTRIDHGVDLRSGEGRSWAQDSIGHGTRCAGVIGGKYRDTIGRQRCQRRAVFVGGGGGRGEKLLVFALGVVDDGQRGPGELGQLGNLARPVHAQLEDRRPMMRGQLEQHQRQADVVVQVAPRRQPERASVALPVGLGEDRPDHLGQRGLAVTSRHRDHRQREPRSPVRCGPTEGAPCIGNPQLRQVDRQAAFGRGLLIVVAAAGTFAILVVLFVLGNTLTRRLSLLTQASNGIIRDAVDYCNTAMYLGYTAQVKQVDERIMQAAIETIVKLNESTA